MLLIYAIIVCYEYAEHIWEPNSENCLNLILVAPCEKVIFVSDESYITSAIKKIMLDMTSPGSYPKYRP